MHIMQAFMASIKNNATDEYIESLIACFAAPTIRGLKAGSLINLRRQGDDTLAATWRDKKDELLDKFRVDALALPQRPACACQYDAILLLLYKKDLLTQVLFTEEAAAILKPLGYEKCLRCIRCCLEHLTERFKFGFPHEIGLFLGYPPEDVREFIRNRGENSLATGYWKVYGDVRGARRSFRQFRRAEHDAARRVIRQAALRAGRRSVS